MKPNSSLHSPSRVVEARPTAVVRPLLLLVVVGALMAKCEHTAFAKATSDYCAAHVDVSLCASSAAS